MYDFAHPALLRIFQIEMQRGFVKFSAVSLSLSASYSILHYFHRSASNHISERTPLKP